MCTLCVCYTLRNTGEKKVSSKISCFGERLHCITPKQLDFWMLFPSPATSLAILENWNHKLVL